MDSSNKVKFRHSIGFSVGIFMAILLLIIMGAKTTYDIMSAYRHSVDSNVKIKQEETKRLGAELEGEFASAYQSGYTAQIFVQKIIDSIPRENRDRNYIVDSFKGIFAENDNIHGMGIYFEPNAYDGMDKKYAGKTSDTGRFASYISRTEQGFNINENDLNTDKEWYHRPIQENRVILLEPYVENGVMMATYAYPLVNEKGPIGVLVVDVSVQNLQTMLEMNYGTADDFKVLVSSGGSIVANSLDKTKLLYNFSETYPKAKEYFEAAQNNNETIADGMSSVSGLKSKMIFIPIKIAGTNQNWVFDSVISHELIHKEANETAIISSAVSVLTILLLGSILFFVLIKKVVRPLALVQGTMHKISNYNLDLTEENERSEKYVKNKDEIGDVIRAMQSLNSNMTDIISNITLSAQNTAATAQELTATAQ